MINVISAGRKLVLGLMLLLFAGSLLAAPAKAWYPYILAEAKHAQGWGGT